MNNNSGDIEIIYGIEDNPGFLKSIPLALQHILAMFAANITVPLLLAGAIGLNTKETTFFNSIGFTGSRSCYFITDKEKRKIWFRSANCNGHK